MTLFHLGFTALCEKYCSNAKSKQDGTDQLTSTLNSYLSQIVQGVLCKFTFAFHIQTIGTDVTFPYSYFGSWR